MAHWLRALAAFPKILGSVLSTHHMCSSSSRPPDPLFWVPQTLHKQGADIHTGTTLLHIASNCFTSHNWSKHLDKDISILTIY